MLVLYYNDIMLCYKINNFFSMLNLKSRDQNSAFHSLQILKFSGGFFIQWKTQKQTWGLFWGFSVRIWYEFRFKCTETRTGDFDEEQKF